MKFTICGGRLELAYRFEQIHKPHTKEIGVDQRYKGTREDIKTTRRLDVWNDSSAVSQGKRIPTDGELGISQVTMCDHTFD